MHEKQGVSVDMVSMMAYLPEIIECIHEPSGDLKRCKGCQFKKECTIISAVGFIISKFINGEKVVVVGSEKLN